MGVYFHFLLVANPKFQFDAFTEIKFGSMILEGNKSTCWYIMAKNNLITQM